MKNTIGIRAVLALTLAAGLAVPALHADQNGKNNSQNAQVRLKTNLAGAAIQGKKPEGSADFRSDTSKGRTQFNVEVENVNLPAATVLDVAVTQAGVTSIVGKITLSAFGSGELELNSQDGATVPAIVAGAMVTVSNAGTPILAGVF
jgi:hypothetical protein